MISNVLNNSIKNITVQRSVIVVYLTSGVVRLFWRMSGNVAIITRVRKKALNASMLSTTCYLHPHIQHF